MQEVPFTNYMRLSADNLEKCHVRNALLYRSCLSVFQYALLQSSATPQHGERTGWTGVFAYGAFHQAWGVPAPLFRNQALARSIVTSFKLSHTSQIEPLVGKPLLPDLGGKKERLRTVGVFFFLGLAVLSGSAWYTASQPHL